MESLPLWCVAALALAGFVQGTLGFGFGMTAMALLPFALPVKEASPIVVALTLPVVVLVFLVHWRHCSLRDGWLLVLGTVIGTPLGVYLLTLAPEALLLRALGLVLLLFSLRELWCDWRGKEQLHFPFWSSFPLATLSGALGGAFNVGGPPVIAYTYAQSWSKEKIVAMLQLVFLVGAVMRVVSMWQSGLFTGSVVTITLWSLVPVFMLLLGGTRVMQYLPTEKMRTGVFFFVGLIGIKFLVNV